MVQGIRTNRCAQHESSATSEQLTSLQPSLSTQACFRVSGRHTVVSTAVWHYMSPAAEHLHSPHCGGGLAAGNPSHSAAQAASVNCANPSHHSLFCTHTLGFITFHRAQRSLSYHCVNRSTTYVHVFMLLSRPSVNADKRASVSDFSIYPTFLGTMPYTVSAQ